VNVLVQLVHYQVPCCVGVEGRCTSSSKLH